MINKKHIGLVRLMCYKYHKSVPITLDNIIGYENFYHVKYRDYNINKSYFYMAISNLSNEYKEKSLNQLKEVYKDMR